MGLDERQQSTEVVGPSPPQADQHVLNEVKQDMKLKRSPCCFELARQKGLATEIITQPNGRATEVHVAMPEPHEEGVHPQLG